MRDFNIIKSLILIVALLVAGILSPSNGLDDAIALTPADMLIRAAIIMGAAIFIHLIIEKKKLNNEKV
jgi:hypothetical protein